jgi:cell division cycle 20-like protein 1 (cofactor of APC complex)
MFNEIIICKMFSTFSFSLNNIDNLSKSESEIQDRFIPSRSTLEDLDQICVSKNKIISNHEISTENDENKYFSNILKDNLISKKDPNTNYQNLNFPSDKIILPKNYKEKTRHIDKTPFKVLDAPYLQDDYYLNVLDWSINNNLSVGLANSVYIWNYHNNLVNKLTYFDDYNIVSGLSWDKKSEKLSIGTLNGEVEIWDVQKNLKILNFEDHNERVGALSLIDNYFLTGSRDRRILFYDLRASYQGPQKIYQSHKQEVCGIKWSPNKEYFASGGNDNKLFVYSPKTTTPIMRKTHKAAVKALGWSEKHYNLLATGAGTADRHLRIWDLNKKKLVCEKDTGSQICNLVFSKLDNEIITSHGFSNNEINIWNLKSLDNVCKLTGHTSRVLYLAISPEGKYVVSGAGDETLRFWDLNYKDQIKIVNPNLNRNFFQPTGLR